MRVRTQAGQEPGAEANGEAMKGAAYWSAPHSWPSLLSFFFFYTSHLFEMPTICRIVSVTCLSVTVEK